MLHLLDKNIVERYFALWWEGPGGKDNRTLLRQGSVCTLEEYLSTLRRAPSPSDLKYLFKEMFTLLMSLHAQRRCFAHFGPLSNVRVYHDIRTERFVVRFHPLSKVSGVLLELSNYNARFAHSPHAKAHRLATDGQANILRFAEASDRFKCDFYCAMRTFLLACVQHNREVA